MARDPNPILLTRPSKWCPVCETVKPRADFYRATRSSDGLGGYCKSCTKARVVAWQKANPELKAASDHRHLMSNPARRARMRERLDRWARENPEEAKRLSRERALRYAAEHPERIKASQARHRRSPAAKARRKRYRDSPEARAARAELVRFKRRLRRDVRWQQLRAIFEFTCAYCGTGTYDGLGIDHVIPVSRGGANVIENVVPCCRSCNSKKGDDDLETFGARSGIDVAEVRHRVSLVLDLRPIRRVKR